jgi:CBS domain-containing protein
MSSPVVAVAPDDKVKDIAALLVERGFSAVPVLDADGTLVGIVSEHDLIGMRSGGREGLPATAREVMTPGVFALPVNAQAARAASLMLQRGFRSLPVTDGGRVVGMVSRRDLLRAMARDDDEIRAQVAALLEEHARRVAELEVRVDDGVVTFVGELAAVDRSICDALAGDVPGVRGIRFQPATP